MTTKKSRALASVDWPRLLIVGAHYLALLYGFTAQAADRGCMGAELQKIKFGYTYSASVLIGTPMDPAAIYRTKEKCAVQGQADFVHDEGEGDTYAATSSARYSLVIGPGQFAISLFATATGHPMLPSGIKGLAGGARMNLAIVDTITVVRPSTPVPTPNELVHDPVRYIFSVTARLSSASPPACHEKQGGAHQTLAWYKTGFQFLGYQEQQLNSVLKPMLVGDDQQKVWHCPDTNVHEPFELVNGWPGRISVIFIASVESGGDFHSGRTAEAEIEVPQTDFCIDVPAGMHLTSASGYDYVCSPLKGDPANPP